MYFNTACVYIKQYIFSYEGYMEGTWLPASGKIYLSKLPIVQIDEFFGTNFQLCRLYVGEINLSPVANRVTDFKKGSIPKWVNLV